jgi:hypothetical protein
VSRRQAACSPPALAGVALAVVALSCGELPSLPQGIAYITPVLLPSPAVAVGDTLRDSLGQAAPLRIYGIGNAGDTIADVTPSFIVTTVPGKSVTIADGNFVVGDSIRSVQIVGRVGDRLQTPPVTLEVVPQPDSIAAATDTSAVFPLPGTGEVSASVSLGVTVTSGAGQTRAAVKGIRVLFTVTDVYPADATIPDTTLVLVNESNQFTGTMGRAALDTTDASGNASRRIRAVPFGFDSVAISASATNLRGIPLNGSPVRFVVTTK